MPGVEFLDVSIGLIFLFLIISLICTVLVELVEKILNQRGAHLMLGLKEMINDPNGSGIIQKIYEHQDVYPLYQGGYSATGNNLPASIPSPVFAKALLNVIQTDNQQQSSVEGLKQAVDNLPDDRLKTALTLIVNKAGTDVDQIHRDVAAWYDANMQGVSGWYKKHAQNMALLLGFLVAAAFNADTISVCTNLSKDRAMRDAFVAVAQGYSQTSQTGNAPKDFNNLLAEVQTQSPKIVGLPIGWSERTVPASFGGWLVKLFGLFFTALATTLGASFWFDSLKYLISIRPKP